MIHIFQNLGAVSTRERKKPNGINNKMLPNTLNNFSKIGASDLI
jgi:hypothetical protein